MLIKQSEGTAARRKVRIFATLSSDGVSGAGSESFSGSDLQVCKAGGSYANAANSGTVANLGDGEYELELSSGECDTLGIVSVKIKKTGLVTRVFAVAQVIAIDPNDAVHLGVSALPNAAAAASGGLLTYGTSTGQINPSSGNVTVAGYASGQAPLQPTVAGRTADITAGGTIGIDLANVESQGSTLNLTATTIKDVTDVESALRDYAERILGLLHENTLVDGGAGVPNAVHSGGKLTSARIRRFSDAATLAAATAGAADGADGEDFRWTLTSTYSGSDLGTHKIAKVL